VWREAGKAVAAFSEGVLTALDAGGFPVSVRQLSLPYDRTTGRMPVQVPDVLGVVEGPANLLCHTHDDQLWNQKMAQLKGRLEREGDGWVFVTTAYAPPSMVAMIRGVHRSADAYLAKRGLPRPKVAFDVIERLWQRAAAIEKP
jgi:hypothetical protein